MSGTPSESEFDLEKLFLPAWAQASPSVNKYAGFQGEDRPARAYDDRPGGRRPPRRDNRGQDGGRPREGRGRPQENRRPRQDGPRDRAEAPAHREPLSPPLQIAITILPDDKGLESLARQIRVTGRAYPLFDIARLVLQKPERQKIRFDIVKKPDGQPAQELFRCELDDTLWPSEDEAVEHVLNRHFNTFYQTERTATEPPRGTYTFVAQCGMSGAILGPPNHHDYQNQLRRLHAERFSRMPFEAFKNRVKIVKDEAVVKKWIEDQSFKTEFTCLNVPEAAKLPNREEVEKHFRQTHKPNIIKPVESHTTTGAAARLLRSPGLQRLMRAAWEDQRRFPLQVATTLSQQFASHGLQFFKVNRTVTHVCVARPHYLDLAATPVSEGVKKIVDFIDKRPRTTRRQLFDALAPGAPSAPAPAVADASTPAAPAPEEPSPELAALAGDLHWLIHQGHVIEFANGILETAKKPAPRRPKPEKKPEPATATQSAEGAPPPAMESVPLAEAAVVEGVVETEPVAATAEPQKPADVPGSPS